MAVMSLGKMGRVEPKGGTRSTYEKRSPAGSRSVPCCPHCGVVFDLSELSMVEQMDAMDGVLLCDQCKESL